MEELERLFGNVVIIPWNIQDKWDFCGHSDGMIRYKTIVEAVHLTDRVDKSYWHIPLSGNESCLLKLVEEYYGTALDEEEIKKHGFKDFNAGSAKLVKGEFLFYIEECFSV